MPRATRAAAALKKAFDVDAELILGSGGIFEVEVNGQVVAKRSFFGFPSENEIVESVGKALGKSPA